MYEPVARILWMFSPIPPADWEILAHCFRVSIDALDAVVLHVQQEAGGHLRVRRPGIEQRWAWRG